MGEARAAARRTPSPFKDLKGDAWAGCYMKLRPSSSSEPRMAKTIQLFFEIHTDSLLSIISYIPIMLIRYCHY